MIGITETLKLIQNPNQLISYFAPTNAQAKKVFWKKLKQSIPYDWIKNISEVVPYNIQLINGSEVTLYGAEAHDRSRGTENDLVICDEFQDYVEDAWFESIYPTLSNRKGRALMIGTPKGKSNWGYELTQNPMFKYFHFTTLDGGWVEESEIELAKQMLPAMEFRQEFEASFETSGLIVYYSYNAMNQSKQYEFDVSRETYLCFDFNVSPMSCIIVQKINDTQYACVKEFILNNSNTQDLCETILEYFAIQGFDGYLQVTGDSAGNKRSTLSTSVSRTDWVIIEEHFKNFKGFDMKKRRTRTIKDRVLALNAMFRNTLGDIKLFVNPYKCPRLHKDLINVEWIDSGFQLNSTNKELTHASDALSYFAYNYFPADFNPMIVY